VWSSDGRKIAFSAYAETSYEIQVMNADGTNLTNVTHSTWNDLDPTWSPDGSRIAFVILDSLPDGSRVSGVRIMNADGTGIESPTTVTCTVPVSGVCAVFRNTLWSPKDDAIAFVMTCLACQYADIWIVHHGQVTASGHQNFAHAWSPDGTRLAFVSDRDGTNEIYIMEADGSNQTRLTHGAGGPIALGAMWPAWSPDGSRIVYASDETGDFEIYIRDFTATRLTHTAGQDLFPACAMSAL
jgi:Tol biopolymer transport system component